MSNLYQMNHGLPGTGINGAAGQKGQKGQSAYFGYINDFFDGIKIDLGSYAYIATRIAKQYTEWENAVHELNTALIAPNTPANLINVLDNSNGYAYFYTGNIYNYDDKYCTGPDNTSINKYKVDFSNDSQLMSVMLSSADGNSIQFEYAQSVYPFIDTNVTGHVINNNITNINVSINGNEYKYHQIYKYVQSGDSHRLNDDQQLHIAHINSDQPFITYNTNDAAYLAYQHDADQTFNNNWVFNTYPLDEKYKKVAAYLDDSLEIVDSPGNSVISTIREIISYNTSDDAINLLTETNLYESSFSPSDTSLLRYMSKGDGMCDGKELTEFDPYQFFKTSIIVPSTAALSTDDIQDKYKYTYYGIPENSIFYNNINDFSDYKVLNPDSFSPTIFPEYIGDYIKKLDGYQNYTRDNIKQDTSTSVKYIVDDNTQIVPSTLKDMYAPGDILYFYLDPAVGTYVDHMVVLTEDMLKCTKSQLIDYAQIINPFNIYYFSSNGDRLLCNDGAIVVKNDTSIENINNYYNRSAASIMSKNNNAGIIIADNNKIAPSFFKYTSDISNGFPLSAAVAQNDLKITANRIKIDNVYVREDASVGAEKIKALYDGNIILENGFLKSLDEIHILNDKNYNFYVGTYLHASDYFYNTDILDDYIYGYDIMDDDKDIMMQNYTTNDTLDMFIPVGIGTSSRYVLLWAASCHGIKYYSQLMHVTSISQIVQDSTGLIRPMVTSCELEVIGTEYPFIKKEEPDNIITCTINKPLTPEKCDNASIMLTPVNKQYEICEAYINTQPIQPGKSISVNTWSNIKSQSLTEYEIKIDSNIPRANTLKKYVTLDNDITTNGDSSLFDAITSGKELPSTVDRSLLITVGYKDYSERSSIIYRQPNKYIQSVYRQFPYDYTVYDVSDNDITENASVYYKDYNTSNVIIYLYDNATSTLTDSFYLVQQQPVAEDTSFYMYNGGTTPADISNNTHFIDVPTHYENLYITQPGFTDTRDVPNFTLNMHNSMGDTQQYNSDTLCNQFVTYMDINVDDFYDKWGQFIVDQTNDISISMSFDVENIISDIDWQQKNMVKDNIVRSTTMKLILENELLDSRKNENYVLLHPSFIKTDNDLTYITAAEPEYINDNYVINTSVYLCNSNNDSSGGKVEAHTVNVLNKKYTILDASAVEYCKYPEYIYNGIQENIKLHFDNVTIHDLNDGTLHLKLLYEFGNPIISDLFLRFAVTNVTINVSTGDEYVSFKASMPDALQQENPYKRRLVTYNDIDDYEYTYMSQPLHVTTNPVSYTICPIEYENELSYMMGSEYKVGSSRQISSVLKFYNASIYENKDLMNTTSDSIRKYHYFNWGHSRIKKSYLQDNIQNIAVSAQNMIQHAPDNNLFKHAYINSDILNKYPDQYNYINIVYDGAIMNSKLRNGIYTFYYNNNEFPLSRYSQKALGQTIRINNDKLLEMRTDELFNAIQVWNKTYVSQTQYPKDTVFTGKISLYGNGYTQLLDSADTGELLDDTLSLAETKAQNNVYIYDNEIYSSVYNSNVKDNEPLNNHYYRTFLEDLYLNYVYDENSTAYRIISDFDMLLLYDQSPVLATYAEKYSYITDTYKQAIPYSLLYNIYPRVCYNIDNNNINVLMLRMPSVENDTDIEMYDKGKYTLKGRYELSTKYFEIK